MQKFFISKELHQDLGLLRNEGTGHKDWWTS